jgi:dihydrofolate synthase/folylpolyglutamate synthase
VTYPEAIRFLYDLRWFGCKLGLENTERLAALAGSPERQLRFLHVAGTNGKGSTCAFLESIYRHSGLRVGLFTSPHLVRFGERIQVNREPMSDDEVVQAVSGLKPWLGRLPPDHQPTFFEAVTVMALRHFAQRRCDLVIWETGMGGRLDATNIVTPLASLITNVQFDHQQWLGNTLAQIATEKAGIIKPGKPVLTAAREPDVLEVITRVAHEKQAPLTVVTDQDVAAEPLLAHPLPLLGDHQRLNAALALATARTLAHSLPITHQELRQGLASVRWPGRLQVVQPAPGRTILLDGAHNPDGAASLATALQRHFPGRQPTLILGILQDKDLPRICATLLPCAARTLLVPVRSHRTANLRTLQAACGTGVPASALHPCASLEEALRLAADDSFVVIAGSLYLVGEALEALRLLPPHATDEYTLNEWTPPKVKP